MGERNWDSYHRWSKTGDGQTEFGKIWFSCSSSRQPWSSTFSSTRKSVTPCSEPKYPWLIPRHVPISIKIWPEIPDEKQPWDSFICPNTGRIVGLSWSVRKRPLFPQKMLHYSFIWMFDAALHHNSSMQHEPCMVQESVFRATVPPCIYILDQMADRNSQLFKDHTNAASQGFCLLLSVGRYPGFTGRRSDSQLASVTQTWVWGVLVWRSTGTCSRGKCWDILRGNGAKAARAAGYRRFLTCCIVATGSGVG